MLPDLIPTVTVRGRFLAPDGIPLSGAIVFRAPGQLTFPQADVILGGPVTVQLDAQGGFEVTLPATDAPDMDPSGWAYIVTEQLAGIPVGRTYNILLPRAQPEVDLSDIAPTDPAKPNWVGVPGPTGPQGPAGAPGSRIYTGTAAPDAALGVDGDLYVRYETTTFLGVTSTTVSTWQKTAGAWAQLGSDVRGAAIYVNNTTTPSTSTKPGDLLIRTDSGDMWQRSASGWGSPIGNLKGPKGDRGDVGATGATGPAGVVQSVNGKSEAAVVLSAGDIGAIATSAAGAAGGVATLGADGKVPAAQLPPSSGGAVASVNGKTGAVVLAASDVGALDLAAADSRYVQPSGIPVTSVAGKTGAVTLAAGDVGAIATGTAVLLTGNQTVAGSKTFSGNVVVQGVGQTQAVVKSADTSRANTATTANDPNLTLPVVANATYIVEAVVAWAQGGGGFRVDWAAPSGATMVWTDNDASMSPDPGTDLTFSTTVGTTLQGALVVGATAGSLTLRWAQNTANAAATVLQGGCYLKLERVA
ncbi:hypothetical protein [Streptomyces sp. NPDC048659]|uniref:hypothetical protein n=1 Tax=Streptomyces sp. NPDC048659 TaxID=3155489 RepID=UPI00344842A5